MADKPSEIIMTGDQVAALIAAFQTNAYIAVEHADHDCEVGEYARALTDAYGSVLAMLGVPESDVMGDVLAAVNLPPGLITPEDTISVDEVDACDTDALIAALLGGESS